MKKNIVMIIAGLLLLSGCATPYQTEKNFWSFGKGFDVQALAQDTWQISFIGNDYTDRAIARKYILRKSAELASQAGYAYFTLLDEEINVDSVAKNQISQAENKQKWLYSTTQITSETTIMATSKGLHQPSDAYKMVYESQFILNSINVEQ